MFKDFSKQGKVNVGFMFGLLIAYIILLFFLVVFGFVYHKQSTEIDYIQERLEMERIKNDSDNAKITQIIADLEGYGG